MKKFISLFVELLLSLSMFAQSDVTKFLGIPVDGTKQEMIEKLEAKGFVKTRTDGVLAGEFNGKSVLVSILTNNDKVWRIMVVDRSSTSSDREIKNRFNTLCRQFDKNIRYTRFDKAYNELCSRSSTMDSTGVMRSLNVDFEIPDDEKIFFGLVNHKEYKAEYFQIPQNGIPDSLNPDDLYDFLALKRVWFTIDYRGEGYRIAIGYDNARNAANGEDL